MKMRFRCFFIAFVLVAFVACSKRLSESSLPAGVKTGDVYYAQVAFMYEKGRHLTTNYRRGILVPVNTQVQLQDITARDISLEILPAHTPLRIENVQKHTHDSTSEAFAKLFGKKPLDLSRFSALEKENILAGKAAKTMSKKAVIAAMGYPPITETPGLDMDQWTYWNSRFDRFVVYFENDRVTRVQD